jgi:hypothetical protein
MKELEPNQMGLICKTEDGRLLQVGVPKDINPMLQEFVSQISKIKPLVMMSDEYELVLKSECLKLRQPNGTNNRA